MTSKTADLVITDFPVSKVGRSILTLAGGENHRPMISSHPSAYLEQPTIQSAYLSEETRRIENRISSLIIPQSPASLPAIKNVKTIEEQLFDATASVKMLTSQVAMYLDREWREKLFRQIDSLHDPEEWEEGDQPVQQSSFATFLKAICHIKPQRRPGLGLSYGGHLLAAWTQGKNRLTIEFLAKDRVRWVISRYTDNEPEQVAVNTSVARLSKSLQPYNPQEWFSK